VSSALGHGYRDTGAGRQADRIDCTCDPPALLGGCETVLSGAANGSHMAPESAIESAGQPGATRFGFGFAFFGFAC
jgi:hypothetical protein